MSSNLAYGILGSFLGFFIYIAVNVFIVIYGSIKEIMLHNKMYKQGANLLEDFKKNGGLHKWVNLTVMGADNKIMQTHVCEHTGFCPALDSFVPLETIKTVAKAREDEEEYQKFKEEETAKIKEFYGIDEKDIEGLVERVLSMKKNFVLQKTEKFLEELREKSE